jgi:hypothetical protein
MVKFFKKRVLEELLVAKYSNEALKSNMLYWWLFDMSYDLSRAVMCAIVKKHAILKHK